MPGVSYSIDKLNNTFYKETLHELENKLLSRVQMTQKAFGFEIPDDGGEFFQPVKKYNPVKEQEVEFKYPLAYHIKLLFYFLRGEYKNLRQVKESLKQIEDIIFSTFMGGTYYKKPNESVIMESKTGFLTRLADKRIKLEEGKRLNAYDIGYLVGLTGQGISFKIKNGDLKAEKFGRTWFIENDEARRFIKNRENMADERLGFYDNLSYEYEGNKEQKGNRQEEESKNKF